MSWFARKLRKELPGWVESGTINQQQADAISALYEDEGDSRRAVALFGFIGAAVVAVGCMLLISANWAALHDWVKIGGVVALTVSVLSLGYWLRIESGRHPVFGDAALMLGSVLFLGGIAVVSQVFHLNARPPSGVLIWWLGIVLIPLITRSKGAWFVFLVAWSTWLAMEFAYPGSWLSFGPGREIMEHWVAAAVLVGGGLLGVGAATRRGAWSVFSGTNEFAGLLLLQCGLYVGGFLRHEGGSGWSAAAWTPSVVLLALWGGGLGLLVWRRHEQTRRVWMWLAPSAVLAAYLLFGSGGREAKEVLSFVSWFGLLALNLSMVVEGVRTGRVGWVNLALVFIVINIFTRYWDLFGSMMQGGVFFVVTGLVIIGIGYGFERSRKRLTRLARGGAA